MYNFYEFFAGGGMARTGLGPNWNCLFANDFDYKKSRIYETNWGSGTIKTGDVRDVATTDLPDAADAVWASFPCQDLSLAGGGAGLKGDRSGTFWPFWNLMKALEGEGRAPKLIVLENVCGTLTSHSGKDFRAICGALQKANYRFGALVMDAALFVPQSRPRLFIVAVHGDTDIPSHLTGASPCNPWDSRGLRIAYDALPPRMKKSWVWWNLPAPPERDFGLADIVEDSPKSIGWHTPEETAQLLRMMSDVNLAKVEEAKRSGHRMVGTIYKRTRRDKSGIKMQRAEVRFDEIAGCLRTPAGGSSRQLIMVVDGATVKSRLLSTREAARLMGLPDSYKIPENYNEAYHLAGDGVVVPAVRHLAAYVLEPVLRAAMESTQEAA